MRVTNVATYRNFTNSANYVHSNLNKSLNKISSGREYESAAESPLTYYQSKKIDDQYLDVVSKLNLITDVKSRLEQQEDGIYDIQQLLAKSKNDVILKARTGTTTGTAIATLRDDLVQKEQAMANDLRTQYQSFYVYGGNDVSTPPFSLSYDGMELTFSHKFPGEDQVTNFVMKLEDNPDATDTDHPFMFQLQTGTDASGNQLGDINKLVQAMGEQGYMDLGYGDIRSRETLLDTFTGGMNVLTCIDSETVKTKYMKADGTATAGAEKEIMTALTDGPLGLVAQSVKAMDNYLADMEKLSDDYSVEDPISRGKLDDHLERLLDDMTVGEHKVSVFYSDLGNKYNTLELTDDKLKIMKDSLTAQYKDVAGADPYASIVEMYNNQYAYNAALQVGSNLMSSSLFDFVR